MHGSFQNAVQRREAQAVSRRRTLLLVAAIVFASATVLYSALWMYYIRAIPRADPGFSVRLLVRQSSAEITEVSPGGPAMRAGLHPGDRILEIDGSPLWTLAPIERVLLAGRGGDPVSLLVIRGNARSPERVSLQLASFTPEGSFVTPFVVELLTSFPVVFVLVGIPVLFLRVHDRNAWLLATIFAGFIVRTPFDYLAALAPAAQWYFAVLYRAVFLGLGPVAFAWLFLTFPVASIIDRRAPWLKHVAAALGIGLTALLIVTALRSGFAGSLQEFSRIPGAAFLARLYLVYFQSCFIAGLLSLVLNSLQLTEPEARRRTRVMVWGTVLGLTPWICVVLSVEIKGLDPYSLPFWLWATAVLFLFLVPLSFAYAVVKHRVLDIPVLIRRSARYLLVQRGFLVLLVGAGVVATYILAGVFARHFPSGSAAAIPAGVLFGVALIGAGSWTHHRVRTRLDRAFFRSSYDAQLILQELVETTREVRTRDQLTRLLEDSLRKALHPAFLALYFEYGGQLRLNSASGPEMPRVLAGSPFLQHVLESGRASDVSPDEDSSSPLAGCRAECVVPLSGRERQNFGALLLGPRLSEEPYSRQDKRLLEAVATQAGATLEHIQLAEEMAERIAAEKRTAHELRLAREVQRKLFPQNRPALETLEYAGECVQARIVGGDYYDFLAIAPGRVGFVIADISGKGFSAALLMANLQANLRSRYAMAHDDLPDLLRSVNALFFENTEPNHYATMFFSYYDEARRVLRYVNCGHNPPLLLRSDGSLQRLAATATVMGLLPDWECGVEEVRLAPGDLLALYTDGITEAASPEGEEFGEERVIQLLRQYRGSASDLVVESILSEVRQFSPAEQTDDLTLVIAQAK